VPKECYSAVVLGAGAFGLRAAELLLAQQLRVAIIDIESRPLVRASLINQARVHNGYHYPRSAYTALRSAHYYGRFLKDFPLAINRRFRAVYAVAAEGSYIDAAHFEKFCSTVGVPARRIEESDLFRHGTVEAAYETDEYTFDAPALRAALLARLERYEHNLDWYLGDTVSSSERDDAVWHIRLRSGTVIETARVVNATYASTNALLAVFGLEPVPLKYELCEVVLVDSPAHDGTGVTIMDGPFFSFIPFGHSGLHSLTAVDYTPRAVSTDVLPTFACQSLNQSCTPWTLANCGTCSARPSTSYPYMHALASRFLRHATVIRKVESLNSVKVVLRSTEVDDARPTLIRVECERPSFITLFGGKINTIYDLDGAL
jgi:glycine/D-amino acid oxidase-like deaminating enzyme